MKKGISAVLLCSSLLLFGCQNEESNNSNESSIKSSIIEEDNVTLEKESSNNYNIVDEDSISIVEESNTSNSEGDSTIITNEGEEIPNVPEDQRIYLDKNTFMDGSDYYKVTQDKKDRKNRESEIVVDGKNYFLTFILPNPDDDTKVDLYYEEY